MNPSTLTDTKTEAGIVASLALETLKTESITQNGIPILVAPTNAKLLSLERLLTAPHRPAIAVNLTSLKDLHAYLIAQALTGTDPMATVSTDGSGYDNIVVFADRNNLRWHAFIDYHHISSPRWLNHTATVQYEHSIQFTTWKKNDGRKMGQGDFAEFLDENVLDIINPTGSDVVTFASCLEARRTEIFKAAKNISNGEVSFIWSNESSGDSTTKFPTEMTLGIPLWTNGELISLPVKLFYRVESGHLEFWYKLRTLEKIIDELFNEDVKWIAEALSNVGKVYRGTPPATPGVLALG